MFKKLAFKRTIITMLLIILSASCFSLLFANVLNLYSTMNMPLPRAADLTISDLNGLQAFANTVNSGNSYSGKTIELQSDIDCKGASIGIGSGYRSNYGIGSVDINYFNGTFNGKGFSIYNFHFGSDLEEKNQTKGIVTTWDVKVLFVLGSNAKICNTRFYNCGFETNGYSYYHSALATCYVSGSSIENCIIDNLTYGSSYSGIGHTELRVGSFAMNTNQNTTAKNINVTNCYLGNCVLNGKVVSFSFGGNPSKCVLRSVINNNSADVTYFTSTQTDCYSSNTGDNFVKLGYNITTPGYTESTWYYDSRYFDGWPYLRSFIEWGEVHFTSYNTEQGSVDKEVIYLPKELFYTITLDVAESAISGSYVALFEQVVIATPKTGFVFSRWELDYWGRLELELLEVEYTAYFEKEYYHLQFAKPTYNGVEFDVAPGGYIEPLKIYYGDKITISVRYSVTDIILSYYIEAGNSYASRGNISYVLDNSSLYTFDSYGVFNTTPITKSFTISSTHNLTVGETYTISPTIKLKEYNIGFG